jgi:hypothetical protein
VDSVLVNEDFKIIAFKTEIEVLQYWNKHIQESNTKITTYDIYKMHQWLHSANSKFDFVMFLNLWNLFTDISESIKLQFIGDVKSEVRNTVYDKLFEDSGVFITNGNNPVFSAAELEELNKIMNSGLNLLLNNLIVFGENRTVVNES